ncbi:MAG: GNAT family N-acetyltransferase, partial [Halanaerobiales bacterium]
KDYEYQHEVINSSRLKLMKVDKNLQEELFAFLQKYFPGRWLYEAQNIARIPGGVEDYRILRYKNKVVGFIRANRSTSTYQGPNVNWGNYYSSQYCGFGPLGIAPQFRGNGWGLYMISKLIKEFKKEGYIHCFIDWTTLVEYYKKLGFEPIFQFLPLKKILEG